MIRFGTNPSVFESGIPLFFVLEDSQSLSDIKVTDKQLSIKQQSDVNASLVQFGEETILQSGTTNQDKIKREQNDRARKDDLVGITQQQEEQERITQREELNRRKKIRQEQEEAARIIRLEKERNERETKEKQRVRREEQERLGRQKEEQERLGRQREEQERLGRQKEEQERLVRQKEEQERLGRQKEEQERLDRQKEQERLVRQKEEQERLNRQKEEQEILNRQKEQERLNRQREEQAKIKAKQNPPNILNNDVVGVPFFTQDKVSTYPNFQGLKDRGIVLRELKSNEDPPLLFWIVNTTGRLEDANLRKKDFEKFKEQHPNTNIVVIAMLRGTPTSSPFPSSGMRLSTGEIAIPIYFEVNVFSHEYNSISYDRLREFQDVYKRV